MFKILFNLRNPALTLKNFMIHLMLVVFNRHKICRSSLTQSTLMWETKNLGTSGKINTRALYLKVLLKMILYHVTKDPLCSEGKIKANSQSFPPLMNTNQAIIENDKELILCISFIFIPFHNKFDVGHKASFFFHVLSFQIYVCIIIASKTHHIICL